MSSLEHKYKQYLEEKFNTFVHDSQNAFITYQYVGDDMVAIDILHVEKQHRRSGEGTKIWEEFKKILPEKVHTCIAEIETHSNAPETPLVAFIKRGFKILKLEGSKIIIYNKFRETEK